MTQDEVFNILIALVSLHILFRKQGYYHESLDLMTLKIRLRKIAIHEAPKTARQPPAES